MLKVDPTDIRKLRVLNPKLVKISLLPKLKSMMGRQVGTVEDEIRADDRIQIDRYIMGEILGISEAEQDEIRKSVVELVKTRHQRAGSIKNGKKTRNGIDLDQLAFDAMHRPEIAEFLEFMKNYMAMDHPKIQDLPLYKGPAIPENTLLGWRVKSGSSILECSSEVEARYYRIFIEMRMDAAPVPTKEILNSVSLRNMESLFSKIDSVLTEINSSILQRRIRDRFIRIFWAHLREEIDRQE